MCTPCRSISRLRRGSHPARKPRPL
jgi:hypothetical protein